MSHLDPDQLAGLALDPTDGPDDVREHAATCPECAGLVAAFTGVRRRAGAEALVAPPARVREQVLAEVRASDLPQPVPLPVPSAPAPTGPETPQSVDPPADTGTVVAATSLTALDSDAERGEASG